MKFALLPWHEISFKLLQNEQTMYVWKAIRLMLLCFFFSQMLVWIKEIFGK